MEMIDGRQKSRDRVAVVYMPIVIVLLTALLGTGVGWLLQNRAFKRNELFRVRLDRLMWLHSQTVDTLHEVDVARRQIRSNEELVADQIRKNPTDNKGVIQFYKEQELMRSSLVALKDAKVRLDSLAVDSRALSGDDTASAAIEAYGEESDKFIACVEDNDDFSRSCSNEHPDLIKKMMVVVSSHGNLIDTFAATYH
jgi:hypothetical protein